MKSLYLTTFLALALQQHCYASDSTYDLILSGKQCEEFQNQQINCNYRIGSDFWLSLAGVGTSNVGIAFMKSEFKGNYYGTYGTSHGCVIIQPGESNKNTEHPNVAFVSPLNGKVYKTWTDCKAMI
ncbi:hypothetical protein GII23_00620 [Stutzerimonas balearica]|uniref:hypothetical protein n=1 Tax=Stutzerimonas balearica TaxID=74829 RepID=UPI0013F437F6|nr:hypothetical protein [Stutzerimonas balearica]QII98668.1 hypothetical protein GII23_00620 [Stutzerimonas balearica]